MICPPRPKIVGGSKGTLTVQHPVEYSQSASSAFKKRDWSANSHGLLMLSPCKGPEWVWPVGFFLRAYNYFSKKSPAAAAEDSRQFIMSTLSAHLVEMQGGDSIALFSFNPFFSPFFEIAYWNATNTYASSKLNFGPLSAAKKLLNRLPGHSTLTSAESRSWPTRRGRFVQVATQFRRGAWVASWRSCMICK